MYVQSKSTHGVGGTDGTFCYVSRIMWYRGSDTVLVVIVNIGPLLYDVVIVSFTLLVQDCRNLDLELQSNLIPLREIYRLSVKVVLFDFLELSYDKLNHSHNTGSSRGTNTEGYVDFVLSIPMGTPTNMSN